MKQYNLYITLICMLTLTYVADAMAPTKPPKPTITTVQTPPASTSVTKPSMVETAYNAAAKIIQVAYNAPGKFMNYWKLSNAPEGKIISGKTDSVASVIGYNSDAGKINMPSAQPESGWNFTTLAAKINDNTQAQKNQKNPGIVQRINAQGNGTRITTLANDTKPTTEYLINGTTIAATDSINIAQAKKAAAATTTLSLSTDLTGTPVTPAQSTYFDAAVDAARTVYHTPGGIAQTLGGTRNGNFITEASVKNVTRGTGNAVVAAPGIALTTAKGIGKGAVTAAGVAGGGLVAGGYYAGKELAKAGVQGGKAALETASQLPGALDSAGHTLWSGNLAKASTALSNTMTPAQTPVHAS